MRKSEKERHNTYTHTHTQREKVEQERTTEAIFLNSDYIANFQGEKAESARLAVELQQARQRLLQINLLLQVLSLRFYGLADTFARFFCNPHALVGAQGLVH